MESILCVITSCTYCKNSLNLYNKLKKVGNYLHFTNEEMELLRGVGTCPGSHKLVNSEFGIRAGSLIPESMLLTRTPYCFKKTEPLFSQLYYCSSISMS